MIDCIVDQLLITHNPLNTETIAVTQESLRYIKCGRTFLLHLVPSKVVPKAAFTLGARRV